MRLIFITQCLLWSIITQPLSQRTHKNWCLKAKIWNRLLLSFFIEIFIIIAAAATASAIYCLIVVVPARAYQKSLFWNVLFCIRITNLPDHFMLHFYGTFFNFFHRNLVSKTFCVWKADYPTYLVPQLFGHNLCLFSPLPRYEPAHLVQTFPLISTKYYFLIFPI